MSAVAWCAHPRVTHEHGAYAAYVLDKCRCEPCREANRVAERARKDLRVVAAWHPDQSPFIAGDVIRAHLRALSRKGMGWKRVAAAAGVGSSTVYPILYGKHVHKRTHPEHRPRRVKVRRDIAERLLAVTADIAPGARVEAIGTQRRIQAMTAAGWSLSWQAKSLGRTTSNYAGILTRSRCEKTTADQVADLYHQVGDRQPAPSGGSTRARRHAERHGWAPAAGWTAETIDDPKTPALPLDPESVAARARATSWGAA